MQPTTPAPRFAFGPRNYRLMWLGLAVLAAGFVTMMLDGAEYGEGFLGLTLGPVLLVVGFVIEFVRQLNEDEQRDGVGLEALFRRSCFAIQSCGDLENSRYARSR